jgi:hypothetical protein
VNSGPLEIDPTFEHRSLVAEERQIDPLHLPQTYFAFIGAEHGSSIRVPDSLTDTQDATRGTATGAPS